MPSFFVFFIFISHPACVVFITPACLIRQTWLPGVRKKPEGLCLRLRSEIKSIHPRAACADKFKEGLQKMTKGHENSD